MLCELIFFFFVNKREYGSPNYQTSSPMSVFSRVTVTTKLDQHILEHDWLSVKAILLWQERRSNPRPQPQKCTGYTTAPPLYWKIWYTCYRVSMYIWALDLYRCYCNQNLLSDPIHMKRNAIRKLLGELIVTSLPPAL